MDAHTPYVQRKSHQQALDAVPWTFNPDKDGDLNNKEHRDTALKSYAAAVRSADEQIGRLLNIVPDDAIVVITADHGEDFEQFRDFHAPSAFSSMTQVPVVIRAPSNGSLPAKMQHLDLVPTIVDAAGIDVPESWDGQSRYNTKEGPENIFYQINKVKYGFGVGTEGWKLIRETRDGREHLYRSQFGKPDREVPIDKHPERAKELSQLLDEQIKRTFTYEYSAKKGWDTESGEEELDKEIADNLEDLGYI